MTPADDALDRLEECCARPPGVCFDPEALTTVRDELQRLRRLTKLQPYETERELALVIEDQEQELHRLNTRLTKTNKDRHQWRERAISAEQQLALHGPSDELQRLREALTAIRDCAKWYGEGERLAHEIHHALVVEVYSVADVALNWEGKT